ncbi:MAG TPA: ECF-type sigma factor [Planctomycetota bacterium]|jgi:RNA polymerase sigma-70 factor (ECF subfamily)|nr:ECF-type sigma factor [Planctomycetota bacterium]
MAQETSMGGSDSRFQSTLWDVVLQAKNGEAKAVDQLARDYWKPVYFFIRRKGQPVESAKDLTQSFLSHLLEKDLLSRIDPEKGKFRSFIMATLGNFLNNERRTSQAQKRGGAFNFVEAEDDLRSADATPEKAFYKGWALTILEQAMAKLRESVPPEDLALLEGKAPPEMTVSEKKNRLFRVRGRLQHLLRESVKSAVEREEDVDSELRAIFASLG